MLNIIRNICRTSKAGPRHLGRWSTDPDHTALKVDYANVDSCGDRLCGFPNQFTAKDRRRLISGAKDNKVRTRAIGKD